MRCLVIVVVGSLLSLWSATSPAQSDDLRLPRIFTDNMVLQQQMPIPIWGWAPPGAQVQVTFAEQTHEALADEQGNWRVDLDPMTADGRSYRLAISSDGQATISCDNVVLGEVWLCAGQSNMNRGVDISDAQLPDIRLFWIDGSTTPRADCSG